MTHSQANDQKIGQSMTPQQHHHRAAKIHELASIHHKEAAVSLASGDDKAAALHARLAYEYAVQATEHGNLLGRPSDLMEHYNHAFNDPLQGVPEQEVEGATLTVLHIQ